MGHRERTRQRASEAARPHGQDGPIHADMVALLPRLRRFALALTGRPHEADDLVQETCERAIRHLERWTPGTRLDSWMYRIAQNLHRNRIRDSANRSRILEGIGHTAPHCVDGAAVAEDRALLDRVRRDVLQLPPEQREVIMLICIEGLPYHEAAAVLGIPAGTVTSRLARARSNLRAALAEPADMQTTERRSA